MKFQNERTVFFLVDSCEMFHVNVQMHTYRSGMVTGVKMCVSGISTTYTHTQPEKTRTGTHHSRALDSPLALAKLRTAIFV